MEEDLLLPEEEDLLLLEEKDLLLPEEGDLLLLEKKIFFFHKKEIFFFWKKKISFHHPVQFVSDNTRRPFTDSSPTVYRQFAPPPKNVTPLPNFYPACTIFLCFFDIFWSTRDRSRSHLGPL